MSYSLKDSNQAHLGDMTIGAFDAIKKSLKSDKANQYPAFEQLIEHGHTNLLMKLKHECRVLATNTKTKEIVPVLKSVERAANKADEILVLVH